MMIHTSLSPNTEADDRRLAAFTLFLLPGQWQRGPAEESLRAALASYLDTTTKPILLSSARSSFFLLLRALDIKEGDEVLVQALTCNAAVNPIIWQGARPIYVDIDDTYNMSANDLERKITPRSKAIVIQHTFGIPADVEEIRALAKKHNIFLIEDCAHALGATYQDKKVGTLGDAAFFSFGRDKVISSVYGGALLVHDKSVRDRADHLARSYGYPPRPWIVQQILHPLLLAPIVATYWQFGRYVLFALQKLHILSKAVSAGEKRGKMTGVQPSLLPNALALLALHQLEKIEYLNNRRRYLAQRYARGLGPVPARGGAIFLRYPLRSASRDALLREAKRRHMLFGDWYDSPVGPRGTVLSAMQYRVGTCPNAERAAEEIFNLPTHINLTSREAERIVSFLTSYGYSHDRT